VLDAVAHQLAQPVAPRRHFTVNAGKRIRVLAIARVAVIALGRAGVEIVDTAGGVHFPSGEPSLAELERGLPAGQFFASQSPRRTCFAAGRAAAFRAWLGL
jgi:hypothetical protein